MQSVFKRVYPATESGPQHPPCLAGLFLALAAKPELKHTCGLFCASGFCRCTSRK